VPPNKRRVIPIVAVAVLIPLLLTFSGGGTRRERSRRRGPLGRAKTAVDRSLDVDGSV
jgi:hypothetical protein